MGRKKRTVERKYEVRNSFLRITLALLSVLLQTLWLLLYFTILNARYPWVNALTTILGITLALSVYMQRRPTSIKMSWIIIMLALPVFGVFFYMWNSLGYAAINMKRRYAKIDRDIFAYLPGNEDQLAALTEIDRGLANQARYITKYSKYPVWQNTDVVYHADTLEALEDLKEELRRAEKFIFMEYYAVEDGEAFAGIRAILKQKAAEGVLVRFFYDDLGSVGFINPVFKESMEADGIECRIFNPVVPIINLFMNNRDHRKITVIDGKVAFTGGYNLANEYFHMTEPYGYWKDSGVKITGDAVRSMTVTFFENWYVLRRKGIEAVEEEYLPEIDYESKEHGFVQPYADQPMDREQVGENVYLNMLSYAREYCWFVTPYLIITDEMSSAFTLAARRGVDVRIIIPRVPDKKFIFRVTKSFCPQLVRAGVKIYEYTPGFSHAKMCIADGEVAACGTINLDYRSLYHHFENGIVIYRMMAVQAIRRDFERMFEESRESSADYKQNRLSVFKRFRDTILRLMSPLL